MQFNIHEAKTQFSKLIAAVERGETVIICRHGVPVAQCQPVKKRAQFPFGAFSALVPAGTNLEHMAQPTDDETLEDMGL